LLIVSNCEIPKNSVFRGHSNNYLHFNGGGKRECHTDSFTFRNTIFNWFGDEKICLVARYGFKVTFLFKSFNFGRLKISSQKREKVTLEQFRLKLANPSIRHSFKTVNSQNNTATCRYRNVYSSIVSIKHNFCFTLRMNTTEDKLYRCNLL
jgi:hypothetical protein